MQKPEVGGGGCPEPKMRDRAGKGEVNGKGWVSVSPPPLPLLVASQSLHTPSTEWIGHTHVCTSTHPQTRGLLHARISAHQRTLLTGTAFSALNLSIPLCLTHTDSLTRTKPLAITTTPPSTQTHVAPWTLAQLQQTHNPHAFTLTPPVNKGPHHLIPPLNFPVPRASTHCPQPTPTEAQRGAGTSSESHRSGVHTANPLISSPACSRFQPAVASHSTTTIGNPLGDSSPRRLPGAWRGPGMQAPGG